MDFGMPTLIENDDLQANIELCRVLSLRFVELNMNFPQYQICDLENTEKLLDCAKKAGIYYTIHLDENMDPSNFNPLISEAYFETVRRTIRAAKKLHVPIINMHMNHGIFITLPDKKVQLYQEYFPEYQKRFREFCGMCEKEIGGESIKITVENTDGFREYEKKVIEELFTSSVFALTWDIGHSHAAANIDEPFLMKHADHLVHFHIHDALGSKNHLTLGTGDIDLKLRILLAKEHHCRCVLETKTIDALRKSVDFVKKKGYME